MVKKRERLISWADTISTRLKENVILKPPNTFISYAMAIISSLLLYGIKHQFGIAQDYPFLLFLLAVMMSAFYGGFGPGLVSTILTAFLVDIFPFITPSWVAWYERHALAVFIYILQGIIVSYMVARQKRIWEEVYKQREWFLVTLESIGDAVIATDTDGEIIYMNQIAMQLTGWNLQEVIGKKLNKVFNIVNEYSQKPLSNPVQKVLESGKIIALENHTVLITKNGNRIPIDDSAAPIKDRSGDVIGVIMVFRDVTQKKRTETATQFMAKASEILSSSLDYKKTLKSIAQIAVPQIADWCVVHLLDENNTLSEVTITHKDPKKISWAKKLQKQFPPESNEQEGIYYVLKTGKSLLYPNISEEILQKTAQNKQHLNILKKVGITSGLIVPILSQKKAIGVITLILAESNRKYDKLDLKMVEELTSRAALAIENARLYSSAQEERVRLKGLVANVPGVVWESWGKPDEKNQRIDFVSDYVETMLGYSVKEWLNTPNFWLSIVHPDDKEKAAREAARTYKSGKVGINRFRWTTKDGKVRWVETQSYMFTDRNGTPAGMRGVTMDITERVELEQRKDEFISMASHELKTPVTSLKVYAQFLEKQFASQGLLDTYPSVIKMNFQIDRLSQLINDLLNLSKIQAGKLEFRYELFDLNKLVSQTVENIQETDKQHQIEITGSIAQQIYGDRDRIDQVVINLLTNALKYSPQSKKIIVKLFSTESDASVSVQDFGMGIPKQYQTRIFDRFYQVHTPSQRPASGLGIGLYISNEIISRHNGTLSVISEEGKGSTFTFSIPLLKKQIE